MNSYRRVVQVVAPMILALMLVTSGFANVPPLIESDSPLSMDEMIDIAVRNHATYQKAVEDVDNYNFARYGAYGTFLPSITTGFDYSNFRSQQQILVGNVLQTSEQWSSSTSWNLTIYETLFQGGARFYQLRQAQLQSSNAELALHRTRDEVEYGVRTATYSFLSAQQTLEVANEVLAQRQDNLRYARARYEAGDVIELDVLQAEIDVGTQENAVLEAEQGVENAREALNLALGVDLNSSFPVDEQLTPYMPDFNPDRLVDIAFDSRPDYQSQQNLIQIYRDNVNVANTNYIPAAGLYARLSRAQSLSDANNFVLWPEHETRSAGVSLDWTLFDGFQREVRRQNAIVERRKAQWDLLTAERQIDANIRQQWRTLTRLYQQIQVTENNRELARRQLELEQERYRLGASSQLNLRNAQVVFIEAETTHIARVLEFFTTLAGLERELGRPLQEVPSER